MRDELQAELGKSLAESIDKNIVDYSKEIEEAINENAKLRERIGILGECLHLQSENLKELHDLKHLIEHAQEGIEKCFERIEEIEKNAHKLPEGNHIRGIECECRLDNRAHEINTKAALNNLWTRQKLLEEQVKILQETRTQLIVPMKKVTREKFKAQYPDIDDSHAKKQHCCPNCKGAGNILYFVETAKDNELYLPCVLCIGKGIVWG